jgi:hypothetical protein
MAKTRTGRAGSKGPKTEPVAGSAALASTRGREDLELEDLDDTHDAGDGEGSAGDVADDLDPEPEPGDDDEPEEPKLESQLEIDAALALQKEENSAALRAHDNMQAKARGNRISAEQVRKVIEKAREQVRRKHLVKRKPGIYTAQPLTTTNEKGERIECPPFMRLPDSMVARLKKARDLRRLIESGVLEDLR